MGPRALETRERPHTSPLGKATASKALKQSRWPGIPERNTCARNVGAAELNGNRNSSSHPPRLLGSKSRTLREKERDSRAKLLSSLAAPSLRP